MCFLIVLENWEILHFNSGFKPRQWGSVYTNKAVCEISKFCFHEWMYMESRLEKFTTLFYLKPVILNLNNVSLFLLSLFSVFIVGKHVEITCVRKYMIVFFGYMFLTMSLPSLWFGARFCLTESWRLLGLLVPVLDCRRNVPAYLIL